MSQKIDDIKAKSRMKRIRTTIAHELINGPRAIFPLSSIDKHGWLEPVLRVTIGGLGVDEICSSFSIYVDNTVNRDDNFLTPIVRLAVWERIKELNERRFKKWPEVRIYQHLLTAEEQKEIDCLLKELDANMSNIQYAVAGLITDRSDTPVPNDNNVGFRNISFHRWNGCQTIEFSFGDGNSLNEELEEIIRMISCYILNLCEIPMEKNYKERYNLDLKNLYDYYDNVSSWDFRPSID